MSATFAKVDFSQLYVVCMDGCMHVDKQTERDRVEAESYSQPTLKADTFSEISSQIPS